MILMMMMRIAARSAFVIFIKMTLEYVLYLNEIELQMYCLGNEVLHSYTLQIGTSA